MAQIGIKGEDQEREPARTTGTWYCERSERHYLGIVKIVLVRHGQPDWSPGGLVSNNPSLTPLGHAQSERLVDRKWGHIDHLWVSPMLRARETVAPLERSLGRRAEVLEWMAEIGPADDWEGSPYDEVIEELRDSNLRPVAELWNGMPGAESFRDFHTRVVAGLQASLGNFGVETDDDHPGLWSEPDDTTLVMVAHGGTNAVVLGHLLGFEPTPWEWDRCDFAHTSVATLTSRPIAHRSAFGLMEFGDVTHLDPDMVTR